MQLQPGRAPALGKRSACTRARPRKEFGAARAADVTVVTCCEWWTSTTQRVRKPALLDCFFFGGNKITKTHLKVSQTHRMLKWNIKEPRQEINSLTKHLNVKKLTWILKGYYRATAVKEIHFPKKHLLSLTNSLLSIIDTLVKEKYYRNIIEGLLEDNYFKKHHKIKKSHLKTM